MKTYFFCIIFTILFFASAEGQNQPFRFAVNFNEFTNLTFQLDCLNRLNYCTFQDYQALWQKEFLQNNEDKIMLESWGKIRNRYQKYFEIENSLQFPLDRRSNAVSLGIKIQMAGFQAQTIEDYQTRLDLLVIPLEREQFIKVINHFKPRFSAWWEKEAKPNGAGFVKKTEELLEKDTVKSKIFSFYNFYQPDLPPNYLVTFNLFYRPKLIKAGSGGQAVENQLVVEFFSDENPNRRIDVVLHEFAHFMFNSIAPEKHIELQNLFIKSVRSTAIPSYGLLDETLASAFGNGVIARLFLSPESWKKYLAFDLSFYNNPNIDKAGKALLPLMDDWLVKEGKLNDENFVKIYLDTLENTFGDKLTAPSLFLSQAFMFLDEKYNQDLRRSIRQTLNISSLYSEQGNLNKSRLDDFFKQTNLSSVFIVQPTNINQLLKRKIITQKVSTEIQKIYKAEKSALYSIKRNENAYIFILIAENDEIANQLATNLASSTKSFIGKFFNVK